jgi:hypothetical protein
MKTQLLEDIDQAATLSLVPSGEPAHSAAPLSATVPAPAPAPAPAPRTLKPRSAFGVWRQRPAGAPQPEPAPAQDAPAAAAPEARMEAPHEAPAPRDPLFEFTLPAPATPPPILLQQQPGWFDRSGRRYMLWGSCVLAGALVIQAGWWFNEERKVAAVLALVADELTTAPQPDTQPDNAAAPRAVNVKEASLAPATPASSPVAPARTAITVPPLVLLAPEPAGAASEPAAAPKAAPKAPEAAPKRERVTETRTGRKAAVPAPKSARGPIIQAQGKPEPEPESAMTATLKACREHGYHAAQCVKRGCSVTKYGFACRG